MGLFAFSQGLISFEEEYRERKQKKSEKINARIHRVLPTWLDFKRVYLPIFRSSAIGTAIGAIPGTGEIFHLLSRITKPNVGQNTLKNLEKGSPEGVSAPEAGALTR